MASDNARHFELRLRKLGIFMLICSMACLLSVSFLFGVIVGNDLDTYPAKISRRMPVRILEWVGLLEVEKTTPAVVIKTEKAPIKEELNPRGPSAQNVLPGPSPLMEADGAKGESLFPEAEPVKELLPPPKPDKAKGKIVDTPPVTSKGQASATEKYSIQVASCKSRKIADDVVKKIGKIGLKARIVTAELKNKGTWYRVLLSDLNGKDKATEAAEKIDRVLKGNKSVVRIQKR